MKTMFPSRIMSLPAVAIVTVVTVGIVCPTGMAGDRNEADVTADSASMVIMAPAGPVLADLRISVDGQAYRLWVTSFLAVRTDVNRDGQLTLEELELIPARLLQQTSAKTAARALHQAAGKTDAAQVAVRTFTDWLAGDLSRSFDVIAGAVQASEAVRLAALIDRNSDGGVSQEELMTAAHALRFRDLDDDQTFSAAELLPFRDPRNQQAAVVPDVADLPFVQLTDDEAVQRAARQILNRYGNEDTVPVHRLRRPAAVGTIDSEESAAPLDVAGCEAWLRSRDFHLTIHVLLADRPNASDLKFEIEDGADGFCAATPVPGRRGRAKLIIDDMPIEVRARGGGAKTRSFLTAFLLQRVSIYDSDKSGYLSEDEFPPMQQQLAQQNMTADFRTADLNADGMLFRDELKTCIERDAIATQSRIEVSVRQDGKTLFKLLDANVDRRLSQRELLEGFTGMLEYDIDGDQRLTESELGTAYALEIGLGQTDSLRMDSMMQGMNMAAQSTDAILPGVAGLDGPEWFRRMDRNQDRDVSLREFLGPHQIFVELDVNRDGLLSAAEAESLVADRAE
ncbi:MAG: hypothetical protein RIK87_04415 [Fuerstiella sp.]